MTLQKFKYSSQRYKLYKIYFCLLRMLTIIRCGSKFLFHVFVIEIQIMLILSVLEEVTQRKFNLIFVLFVID